MKFLVDGFGLVLVELFRLKAHLRLSLDLDCHSHSDLLRRSSEYSSRKCPCPKLFQCLGKDA